MWKVGENEYKLKLTSEPCLQLEKALGKSVFAAMERMQEDGMMEVIINILFYALQAYNHGIQRKDVFAMYDKYLEDGNTLEDTFALITEVLETSGFFKKDQIEKAKQQIQSPKN